MLIKVLLKKATKDLAPIVGEGKRCSRKKFELTPLVGEGNVGKGQKSKGITS